MQPADTNNPYLLGLGTCHDTVKEEITKEKYVNHAEDRDGAACM